VGLDAAATDPDTAAPLNVAAVVQHHPARRALLPSLLAALDGLRPQVVSDEADNLHWNAWQMYLRCLRAAPADCSHLLTIQDDARCCKHFNTVLPKVLAAKPEEIVCLYVGGGGIGQGVVRAADACRNWTRLPGQLWLPLVATVLPITIVAQVLAWADQDEVARRARMDDGMMGRFLRQRKLHAWATVPSLVQHPDQVESLIRRRAAKGRDRHRVAACYIGEWSPLDIHWEG